MWSSGYVYAQDVANQAAEAPQGTGFPPFMFMIVIFGVMYLFLILPNQRREKARRRLLSSLNKGDEVITNGGICGTIVGLSEKTVVLKVSDSPVTKIEFVRGSVTQVSSKAEEDKN